MYLTTTEFVGGREIFGQHEVAPSVCGGGPAVYGLEVDGACHEGNHSDLLRCHGRRAADKSGADVDTGQACNNQSGEGTPCALRSMIRHACLCMHSTSTSFRRIICQ